jgi:hypothetical protein
MSGDGAKRDADGYIWITGRVDDMLNCSGTFAQGSMLCIFKNIFDGKFSEKLAISTRNYCDFVPKIDHIIGFQINSHFIGENCSHNIDPVLRNSLTDSQQTSSRRFCQKD